jgi:hypothetical protein
MALACIAALALLLLAGAAAPLAAQEAKKDDAKTQASATPAPSAEQGFKFGMYEGHSDMEVGYRWVTNVAGSSDMYRSMINLGEGPKLLHSNLSLRSKYGSGGLFDRLDLSIDNWGGDPYNTLRLNMSRSDLYEFRADYRKLNYYNFIPTYANPLLGQGSLFDQHGLDVAYRSTDLELKLFPNSRLRPYVGYTRTSGFGPGFTTYSLTGNEFILNTRWQYTSDEYRGGLEISIPTLTLTVEQGYRFLKNDTSAYDTDTNSGNGNNRPFFGQPVTLTSLNRGYHDRTSMPVTKLMAKWTPFNFLKFTGRYAYSMADIDSALGEVRTGSLVSLEDRLFYRSALDGFSASGKQPNHNGSFTLEFSPFSRITFLDQFDTRRNHISGDAILATTYFGASSLSGGSQTFDAKAKDLLNSFLAFNRTHNQLETDFDLGYGLVARGGYRYTFVEASLSDTQNGNTDTRSAEYSQQTGIFGIAFRPGRWLHLGLDYETNSSAGRLLRTDLVDYNQFKFDWRLEPVKSLSLTGSVSLLGNRFSHDDVDQRAHNRNYAFALSYDPGERLNLSLDYQRSDILSAMAIILPQTLNLDRSFFDERGSSVGGSMGIGIYHGLRTDFGYRVILNAGSFPLNFYQPFASLSIPLPDHFTIRTNWQYFGYNEKGTNLQDYRTHLITIGLAYSR